MDPSLLVGVAALAAQVTPSVFRALRGRDPGIFDPAIATTCSEFPGIELEPALREWTSTAGFRTFLDRIQAGDRDAIDDGLVDSFIEDGGFYLADDDDLRDTAERVVGTLVSALVRALLRSDDSIPALANRLERVQAEQRDAITEHFDAGLAEMKADLLSELRPPPAVALAKSSDDGASADPEQAKLSAQIDLANGLFEEGNATAARKALEQVQATAEKIPEDLRFRLLTILGACAIAAEDIKEGCTYLADAHRIRPDDPAALANAAAAARLQNDQHRAIALARQALELKPRDSHAAAVLVEALWDARKTPQLDEFISAEGWMVDDPLCALTLARVWTAQHRFGDALQIARGLVAENSDDYDARLVLAGCLLEESQAGYSGHAMASCREAECHTSKALDFLNDMELPAKRIQALSIRAGARLIRNDSAGATNDIEAVLREVPDDPNALCNKGVILLHTDDLSGARDAFARIENPEIRGRALLLHAGAAFWSGDAEAAVELLRGNFSLTRCEWDDIRKAELLSQVEKDLDSGDSVGPLLAQALEQSAEDPRLLGLGALRHELRGERNDAEEALLKAVALSSKPDHHELLWRLANLYTGRERYSEAADQYIKVVGDDILHPAVMALLGSLRNSGRRREALSWARKIREQHPWPPKSALETEAQIMNQVGDVSAAAERWAAICSRDDATMLDRTRFAQALLWRGEHATALTIAREIDASKLQSEPRQLLSLAQLKHLLGDAEYLNDAYMARRHGIEDPSVHLGYFALFLSQDKDALSPETVEPGCAVLLKDEVGEQWWSILEDGEPSRSDHELRPGAELAKTVLGRRRGDTVTLQEGIGELACEVADIQSKYVRAFQETAADFPTRFPGNTELASIAVDRDDFSNLLGLVDRRDRFAREVQQLYRDDQVPFAFVCARLEISAPKVWRECTERGEVPIRFGAGNESEANRADETLRCTDSIVLDMLALLTAHALDLAEPLRTRFDRVTVPQPVLDEIRALVYETTLRPGPHATLGRSIDGSYAYLEMSDEEWAAHQGFARSLLALAESFDPMASYPTLDVPSADLDALTGALTRSGVGAIFAGGEDPTDRPLLVSDDLGLSAIAREAGAEAVNTQAVLLELRQAEVLTDKEYSSLIARLTQLNYRFVRVDAADILRLLGANGYMTDEGTRALLRALEGPECTEDSAVSVVVGVVASLATRRLPEQQESLLVSMLLAHLHRGREMTPALRRCYAALESKLASTPSAQARILSLVGTYIQIVKG